MKINGFGFRTAMLAAVSCMIATPATAQMSPAMGGMKMSSMSAMDREFVMKAAQGGNAEISAGRLALSKSKSAATKAFAQKMIAEHMAANAKLASIVMSMGGTVSKGVSPKDAAMREQMMSLSGTAFDAAYAKGQVAGHEKMAALMQKEAASGSASQLKRYALTTLPTVQQHLGMARKLAM